MTILTDLKLLQKELVKLTRQAEKVQTRISNLEKQIAKEAPKKAPAMAVSEISTDLIKGLRKYYIKHGISALKFNCKYYKNCLSKCEVKSNFSTAREPFIGKNYGKAGIPRVLFLSLDPGESDKDPKAKTIQAMRKMKSDWILEKGIKPRHWWKTHQFTWAIFDELSKFFKSKLDFGQANYKANYKIEFDPATEIHKTSQYFAHTNSAKCCMNNDHAKQANKALFNNCREFIPEEIKIFNPHILVTQGLFARKAIEDAIGNGTYSLKKSMNISKASSKQPDLMTIEINNTNPVMWIHHYHPSNYGTFTKNYHKYRTYAKEAAKFIKKNYPELL